MVKKLHIKENDNRYEARQRTALDGRVWWCVYDTLNNKWSTNVYHGKYKTKKDCEYAISKINDLKESNILNDFVFNKLGKGYYEVVRKSTGDEYEVGTENGSWWIENGTTSKSFSSKFDLLNYLKQDSDNKQHEREMKYNNTKWGVFLDGDDAPFAIFDDKAEAKRTLNRQMAINGVDGYIDKV